MSEPEQSIRIPPPLVAAAGWVLPGAGYWLLGQRTRAMVVCVAIILLYVLGLLVAGVRVIEVPGYDSHTGVKLQRGNGLMSELANKPWFAGQILAGPICIASAYLSVDLAQRSPDDYPRPHSHLETMGTLYTAIAGMLNLLVIIDAAHRAGNPPDPEAQEAD